jgi:predicted polyphosphate/ATP-dependent NAD kinase
VNPIAGMGGSVGLKGTDGPETLRNAIELGAKPRSPVRAKRFLLQTLKISVPVELYTCAGSMGEDEARSCGIEPNHIFGEREPVTQREDTKILAKKLAESNVDLLVFCGGDGTARDIADAIDARLPTLGIPAGVKVYSAVFGANPEACAAIAADFLAGRLGVHDAEVMDINEDDFRSGKLSARLYGYLKVPVQGSLMQHVKSSSPESQSEKSQQEAIAKHIIEEMDDDVMYIIGPGSTTKAIGELLGSEKTLLGVDIFYGKRILARDVNENQILNLIRSKKCKIIVTPIGGQGYIFGRGNQQLSPSVIESVGTDNIIVVATKHKLHSLPQDHLLVDTGDPSLDELLKGYIKIVTGYKEMTVQKVE